ncbi:hypothetical protein DH2020_043970 [Rehmannia glutinosa]|uniref:O-fucosyltransferase family protein n=1 Tax=Rehmannia glutinosa TaxID=99300 RepID=A0ABR0UJJ5_REHGL
MHAYNRLPSSGNSSPSSPPASPLSRSPRYRHRGSKSGRPPPKTLAQRLAWILLSVLLKRQGIFLFAPLLYIAGMLFYMGTVSFDVVPVIKHRPAPGLFIGAHSCTPRINWKWSDFSDVGYLGEKALRIEMDKGEGKGYCYTKQLRKDKDVFTFIVHIGVPESNGYIFVEANGGLNQQRTSVGYLNATLVIPNFHFHSIWRDPSKFGDIYDEEFFIKTLENDVRIVKTIPGHIMERFDYNMTNVYNFRIKAWSSIQYYSNTVLPKLLEEKVIRISPFANRLSFDAPPEVQRLRCLANYQALRFADPISTLGETLVARMKERSTNNSGKYISVHLRFEEDMVAFSCCVYDGGEQEKLDMDAARERASPYCHPLDEGEVHGDVEDEEEEVTLTVVKRRNRDEEREERRWVAVDEEFNAQGMGFDRSTSIYLASGRIYDSERYMAPLLEMFPFLQTKEMLASAEELAPFQNYSSRMAAIDYTVCLHSEVFVTTQGGNFPQFLLGHRRYLFGGHSRTIKPDKRKLALLFDNPNIG